MSTFEFSILENGDYELCATPQVSIYLMVLRRRSEVSMHFRIVGMLQLQPPQPACISFAGCSWTMCSQGNASMLFRGKTLTLIFQHFKSSDNLRSRIGRVDDIVD